MKRFKVFKIIYYSFAVVIGIILCFILPSSNQFSQYQKYIKEYMEDGKYNEVASLNAPYVNGKEVASVEKDGTKAFIYESITAQPVKLQESSSYAEPTYVGLVFYPKDYEYAGTPNASGNTEYKRGLVVNGLADKKIEMDETSFYYMQDLDFFYFEITESEFKELNVEKIENLSILNNKGEEYLKFENINLNFNSDFYDLTREYVSFVSQYYTDIPMTINGEATYSTSGTTMKSGTKISYKPFASGTMTLNAADLEGINVAGATKKENSNVYDLSSKDALSIEFTSDKVLTSIVINYGELEVVYGFNGVGTYTLTENVVKDKETTIGKSLDEDKVVKDYEEWKTKYNEIDGYMVYNNSKISRNATIWTIVQIVLYGIIMLVIGDLLVGKRHIISLCSRLFGKRRPKSSEEVQIENVYEVNVACTAYVPVGYTDKVSVVYAKENGDKMIFELDAAHNYKLAKRYQNGQYEFKGLEAKGLHLIRTNRKINVRGYRFELILNLAYDEVKPESSTVDDVKANTPNVVDAEAVKPEAPAVVETETAKPETADVVDVEAVDSNPVSEENKSE